MTAPAPTPHRWSDVAPQQLTPHIVRQFISTDAITIGRFQLTAGGVVPRHAHHHEQVSSVLSGRLRFVFDDREVEVGAGGVLQIPGHVPHEVHVIEDTLVIDVFSPVREDWRDGTDTYFTAGVVR